MDLLTRDDLRALMEASDDRCVSIYMPTHLGGQDIPQDKIRFKNLLKAAEERLHAVGVRGTLAKELLTPAEELLETDSLFWVYQSQGLAVFVSRGLFRTYRLPTGFEEFVVVANRFHIKPLLPLIAGDGRFYLLALSQNQVRVFQGTRHGLAELNPPSLPRSLAEALKHDQREEQLQFHTRTGERKGGERAAVFFSHGVGAEIKKDDVLRYFREVDAGLRELLRDKRDPLLLAGVEYLFPIYREANAYPHLLEAGIPGNPEDQSPEQLHRQAWGIMEPLFLKAQEEAIAQYWQSAGTGLASSDLREIVPAADYGRVHVLFVAKGVEQWGTFDPDAAGVELHDTAEPGDADLFDLAATRTLLNGGTVYAVEPEKVPGGLAIAAVFRY